ncbi:unnamed protein product, partial [marine sediment metagenome]
MLKHPSRELPLAVIGQVKHPRFGYADAQASFDCLR